MTPRPNIIYIVCDDLGYADLGCYGGREADFGAVSPNIDRLANGGMKFTAYIGDLDFSALKDNINMLAKKEIVLKADKIRIEATTEFSFVGGGSYGVYKSGSIETGTTGSDIRHAASHSLTQLKSLPVAAVQFPEPVCKECLRKAMAAASPFGGR